LQTPLLTAILFSEIVVFSLCYPVISQFAELSDLFKHGAIPGLGGDGKSKPGKDYMS
jgi:hypothetical protein